MARRPASPSRLPLEPAVDVEGPGEIEARCALAGERLLIGVDEAGRGPLAGPVTVAAVVLPPGLVIDGLDDSKRLTEARRERLFDVVQRSALAWSIQSVGRDEIDALDILQATFVGMRRAIVAVIGALAAQELAADRVLIDGKLAVPWPTTPDGLVLPPQTPVVKGDHRSRNIAAASILAKVTRDRLLVELDERYPGYGFARHKGYPTADHRAAIAALGPCPEHRRSFRGVREHLGEPV